jgi:hypothetical protein
VSTKATDLANKRTALENLDKSKLADVALQLDKDKLTLVAKIDKTLRRSEELTSAASCR